MAAQHLHFLAVSGRELHPPGTQVAQVKVSLGESVCAEPFPSGLAILHNILVVVFRYGDTDHYFVGASQ